MNRKLLALALAVLLPLGLLAGSGDVNGDGKVNVVDIIELINYLKGNPSEKFNILQADVNLSGSVDEYDVESLTEKILSGDNVEIYFKPSKDEYHLINPGSQFLYVSIDTNLDYESSGGYIYTVTECEGDWLKSEGNYLQYDNNFTGKDREAKVTIKPEKYDISCTVRLIQHDAVIGNRSSYHTTTCQPQGGILEVPIVGNTSLDVKVGSRDFITYEEKDIPSYLHRLDDEIRDGNRIIRFNVDANESDEERYSYDAFTIQVGDGNEVNFYFRQLGKNAPSFDEQKEALKNLYESTNGDKWIYHTNWLTDKPVNQWHGVNNDQWGNDTIIGDYILSLQLQENMLRGALSSDFHQLMWIPNLNIEGNGIYGKIDDPIKNHPMWGIHGWNIILQSPWASSGKTLDLNNAVLKLDNTAIDHVNGDEKWSDDLFSKHELSTIMIGIPSDYMANIHLSYHNKGYSTIVSTYGWLGGVRDETVETSETYPIKDINYIWNCEWSDKQLSGLRNMGTWYVMDKKGQLVSCLYRDWDVPESWYAHQVDSICRAKLGEPEDHESFVSSYYTSENYSADGEVVILQQATEGKGIDIVFMGDAYVDKDMDFEGKYETDMRQGMECFFAVEPYKSLRNRFNVYAVKVVSPNDRFGDDCKQKLNYDDETCFSYAQKIDGIDMDHVTIVNIVNNPDLFRVSGYANMYDKGSSVAHIERGGPSSIIVHEAGGHGFAKLLDEYIFGGYEENHTKEGENEGFRNWVKTEYHDKGWGMNISATDNAEEVPWAHFLKDDRYKDEIGIYKGAWMWPEELWRPSENSVMNNDYTWFNAPSREAIYKRIMKLSEGDTWTYDYETFVTFDAPIREAYKAGQSRSRARGAGVQQRRIESRPPTIYKGTWRDAGKCEKIEYTSR